MTDNGEYITVDVGEMGLAELVEKVRQTGRPVRISVGGEPVAEMKPVDEPQGLPPMDPKLKPIISPDYDPVAGLDEEDWPSHLR